MNMGWVVYTEEGHVPEYGGNHDTISPPCSMSVVFPGWLVVQEVLEPTMQYHQFRKC